MIAKPRRNEGGFRQRTGAVTVEMALILPLLILVTIGLCVAQLGAFRYHQIAALAHESARWASVHGKEYVKQTNQHIANSNDIFENVIKPRAVGLNLSKLKHELVWEEDGNVVHVSISFEWTPEAFFTPRSISCTATSFASY